MNTLQRVLIALGLIAIAGATAQTEKAPGGKNDGPPAGRDHIQKSRELLEEVLMARLTKELALDADQTAILARHLADHRSKMVALRQERLKHMRALKQAVRESKDQDAIAALLEQVAALDEQAVQARKTALEVPALEMTAWQKARLFLFMHEFEADMRRLLKRAQEHRKAAGNTAGNAATPPEKADSRKPAADKSGGRAAPERSAVQDAQRPQP